MNKAIGSEKLFITNNDYFYFLRKMERFLLPWADFLSYCLIPNHFHLLVTVHEFDEIPDNLLLIKSNETEPEMLLLQAFSNFFNSYTKSYNKIHYRSGRLFLYPFKRILVNNDDYFIYLISYIHRNPIHHGITDNYISWKYSSYNTFLSDKPTNIDREYILSLFGSKEEFISFHEDNKTKQGLKEYIME
ncbi:MAG: transposase [Chlorobi bacterium]|nr:transposase [Chlorobiota bacterium]